MRSFVLLLLVIGIVMIALGYQKKIIENTKTKTLVEYRFIPRSVYDDQFNSSKLESNFADMFENKDVFVKSISASPYD